METFMAVYAEQLKLAVEQNPEEYGWSLDKLPDVVARMRVAISNKLFNHNSTSFRNTCNILGIKHTRKAIFEFINTHQ